MMRRVQFYPSEELYKILTAEAEKNGVSISKFVTAFLECHWGVPAPETSVIALTQKVLKEVEEYVADITSRHAKAEPFALEDVSAVYREIPMTEGLKPSAVRASIGRSFKAKIGKAPFENVRVYEENGKAKLSANNALRYEIVYNSCEETLPEEPEEPTEEELDATLADMYPNSNYEDELEEWDGVDV